MQQPIMFHIEDYHQKEEIIKKLKMSEEEIENGEGIESDIAFKELRQEFGY